MGSNNESAEPLLLKPLLSSSSGGGDLKQKSNKTNRKSEEENMIREVEDEEDEDEEDDDDEDDDDQLKSSSSLFPPRSYSPNSSPSNSPTNFFSSSKGGGRSRKRKDLKLYLNERLLSIRSLRIVLLVLLSVIVIVCLFLVNWNGPNHELDELSRLKTLKNQDSDNNNLLKESDPRSKGKVKIDENEESVGELDTINLSAPDGSIYATFLRIGASVQSLLVKDRNGKFRDIVLGYDDTSKYLNDPINPRFGSIVGRYANRIKNSSFTIPNHPHRTFHTTPNENQGRNTLHGGEPGWDRRPFKVEVKNLSYISFSLIDNDGDQGFPSRVSARIEYELLPKARWRIKMTAEADGDTPIMLSSHVYWNLDSYRSNGSASEHLLRINSSKFIEVDEILIPTGKIRSVVDTPLDFLKPEKIGSRFDSTKDLCGKGCVGYDNAWIYEPDRSISEPAMEMWSQKSGIKMSVITDKPSLQVYSCNSINPSNDDDGYKAIARKSGQSSKFNEIYENHSCVVLEQQSYIDGINHFKEWKVDQIFNKHRKFEWNSIYKFSVV